MNFGNFSTVALSAVMVTYAQHPFFSGNGQNDCFCIWCLRDLATGREVPPDGQNDPGPSETEGGCSIC